MVSEKAKAVLLLTAHLGNGQASKDARPLTPTEWGRFAKWLHDNGRFPEDVMRGSVDDVLSGWSDPKITLDRIRILCSRSMSLGLQLEKWERSGIWIMTRSDTDYPRKLKSRLGLTCPPVFFGCGDRRLLGQRSVAIVGSRNAGDTVLEETSALASQAASENISIISGGARGIDQEAMRAALDAGGMSTGILAEGLLKAASSSRYRGALRDERLVLISPYHPEARFNTGNAMGRNKYIYCLADAAVVMNTSHGSGGTWSGAVENLKKSWVPLWVRHDKAPGHEALIEQGARWLPEPPEPINSLLSVSTKVALEPVDLINSKSTGQIAEPKLDDSVMESTNGTGALGQPSSVTTSTPMAEELSFYEFFLSKIGAISTSEEFTATDLAESMDLPKSLVDKWLKTAATEGRVVKKSRPVRYVRPSNRSQASLFLQ